MHAKWRERTLDPAYPVRFVCEKAYMAATPVRNKCEAAVVSDSEAVQMASALAARVPKYSSEEHPAEGAARRAALAGERRASR